MKKYKNINFSFQIRRIIIFVLFMVVIALPLLEYVMNISTKYENTENRTKAPLPRFDLTHLDPFPSEFENYYNDNHNFRGDLLLLNSKFKLNFLNISPVKDVVEGKEGWFYRTKYIEPYINERLFSNIELDSLVDIYSTQSKWLEEQGIKQYLVIVPNKSQIYPEFLPSRFKKRNEVTKTEQFIQAVQQIPNLDILYLKNALISHKNSSPYNLFYKTDQHWNEYGALIGLQAIINEIKKDFTEIPSVNLADYKIDTSTIDGLGLAKTVMQHENIKELNLKVTTEKKHLSYALDTTKYSIPIAFPYKDAYQLFFGSSNSDLPKALIIRDSFSVALVNKLTESFSQTTLIWDTWCYELHQDIVLQEKPDIFITIIIESNLPYIIYKHPYIRSDHVDVIAVE